jgi:hypothetical protein
VLSLNLLMSGKSVGNDHDRERGQGRETERGRRRGSTADEVGKNTAFWNTAFWGAKDIGTSGIETDRQDRSPEDQEFQKRFLHQLQMLIRPAALPRADAVSTPKVQRRRERRVSSGSAFYEHVVHQQQIKRAKGEGSEGEVPRERSSPSRMQRACSDMLVSPHRDHASSGAPGELSLREARDLSTSCPNVTRVRSRAPGPENLIPKPETSPLRRHTDYHTARLSHRQSLNQIVPFPSFLILSPHLSHSFPISASVQPSLPP